MNVGGRMKRMCSNSFSIVWWVVVTVETDAEKNDAEESWHRTGLVRDFTTFGFYQFGKFCQIWMFETGGYGPITTDYKVIHKIIPLVLIIGVDLDQS